MEDGLSGLDLGSLLVDVPQNKVCRELEIVRKDQERYQREIDAELDAAFADMTDEDNSDEDTASESDEETSDKKCAEKSTSNLYESSVGASEVYQNRHPKYDQSYEKGDYSQQSDLVSNGSYAEKDRTSESEQDVVTSHDNYHRQSLEKQYGNSDQYGTNDGHYNENDHDSDGSRSALSHQSRKNSELYAGASLVEDGYQNNSASSSSYKYLKDDYASDNHVRGEDLNNGDFNRSSSRHFQNPTDELQDEFLKLQIIHKGTCCELENLKRAEMKHKKETEQIIRTLELKQTLLEDEKNRLSSNLQESQNLVSDFKHENNILLGRVNALELQLSAMTKAKEEVSSKLDSYEVTIHSLEKQIGNLNRTESLSQLRHQQDKIFEEMKLRHQKEVLKYKEIIDEFQGKLNAKVLDTENLITKNSELQQKLEQLQLEKVHQFNKMSTELEAAQKRCQQYLESGTIEEVSRLKLQVQQLEEGSLNIEKENAALKADIKSLTAELSTAEALQKLAFSSQKVSQDKPSLERQKDINLQSELENSLKNLRTLRSDKQTLKRQLKDAVKELTSSKDNVTLFESRWIESEKKAKELEEQLRSLNADKSSCYLLLEQKCESLQKELTELRSKLHEYAEKFRKVSHNENVLSETNAELRKTISELVQKHAEDRIKAVEECREKYLELHDNALKKEREKMISKAEAELKDVCMKYENKIAQMDKDIKTMKDGLYDSKTQFLSLYEENQSLQAKLDSISKPKEREEIEKEVLEVYEKKFKHMKETLITQNKEYFEKHFNAELEKSQLEWTNKKMADVKDFIESTKQRLDEEFQNCLQKERNLMQEKLEAEKESLQKKYDELMENLRKQYEGSKEKLNSDVIQNMKLKQAKEMDEIIKHYEQEISSSKHLYESKISSVENELKSLKEHLALRLEELEEVKRLNENFMLQEEIWQKEKAVYESNKSTWNVTEKKLHDKIKKYQRHVAASEKQYKEKLAKLQNQLSNLEQKMSEKQNELLTTKKKFEQEISDFGEKFRNKYKNASSQTHEEFVTKQKILDMEEQFFNCLKNISNGVRDFAFESKKRHAKQLEASLQHYHLQLSERSLQDLSKTAQCFMPTFVIPRTNIKPPSSSSKEAVSSSSTNSNNVKFKTSTPDLLSCNKIPVTDTKHKNGFSISDNYSTIPSATPDTNVKGLFAATPVSNTKPTSGARNLHDTFKTPTVVDWRKGSSLRSVSSKNELTANHVDGQNSDVPLKFDDISYDFLNLNISDVFNPSKLPGYSFPQSAYERETNEFLRNLYPVKLSRS